MPHAYASLVTTTLLAALLLIVRPAPDAATLAAAVQQGADRIVEMQQGADRSEWQYEGVYRVGGKIPEGYRVGGTAIAGEALLRATGYATNGARKEAIARATAFICEAINEPLLQVATYKGGYDVRAWGACYGARFLLALKAHDAVPVGKSEAVEEALAFYIDALHRFEIPEVGGWNYARDAGVETASASSPFMTPACLQTLFAARAQGIKVDSGVVSRALDALERCRTPDGNYAYASKGQARMDSKSIPGAVGRMVSAEAALFLAGRSDAARLRFAVDSFIQYWAELEKRRAKSGTHMPPYGVAPYYFWFAHYHAAQAVELLPEGDRPSLRAALNWLLWQTRTATGTWNDRVFARSAAYGTAMAIMSVEMPKHSAPPGWN